MDPYEAVMAKNKNIIVFGETGAGKSSLVNMLMDRPEAKVGNGAKGVTFASKKHTTFIFGTPCQIFDTVGLNEGDDGKAKPEDAISQLARLIQSLEGGLSLLVFCMRGRVKRTTSQNYELFYKIFCDSEVPIILVVTGLEELEEDEVDGWWDENQSTFKERGMVFKGCVCGTTTKGKRDFYANEFNATRTKLRSLINDFVLEVPWTKAGPTWFGGIMRTATKLYPAIFGNFCRSYKSVRDALIASGGFSPEEAEEMAREAI